MRHSVLGVMGLLVLAPVWGQQGIYSCVDAKGRRITADRPILECLDRDQIELSPGGHLKRTIKPPLTADEAVAEEARQRKLSEERARVAEERRRDRSLLLRYPNLTLHERDRQQALAAIDVTILQSQQKIAGLRTQKEQQLREADKARREPAHKGPDAQRPLDDTDDAIASAERVLGRQMDERAAINARFDQELARLRPMWSGVAANEPPAPAPTTAR